MLSIDHDDHANDYGRDTISMDGKRGNNNHNGDGDGNGDGLIDGGVPRPRPSVTRYSNGSEFNASLVAQRGTVRQRLVTHIRLLDYYLHSRIVFHTLTL